MFKKVKSWIDIWSVQLFFVPLQKKSDNIEIDPKYLRNE